MIATAISDKIKLYLPLKPNTKAQLAALIPDARWRTLPYATRKAVVRAALAFDRRLDALNVAFQVARFNLKVDYNRDLFTQHSELEKNCCNEATFFAADIMIAITLDGGLSVGGKLTPR